MLQENFSQFVTSSSTSSSPPSLLYNTHEYKNKTSLPKNYITNVFTVHTLHYATQHKTAQKQFMRVFVLHKNNHKNKSVLS